jgi:hypothetical protein
MVPYPRERKVRLTDIEDHRFIPKKIKVQALPLCGALLDEQKTFERNSNLLIVHYA